VKAVWASSLAFVLAAACGSDPVSNPPPRPRVECTPDSAGLSAAERLEIPGITIPEACHILEDDGMVAVHRRQVTNIRTEPELQQACRLTDPAPIAGLVDFRADRLILVRIPNISAPAFAVRQEGLITIGESTAECTGIEVKPLRYVVRVPATSTVTFHLCAPSGCDEEDPS
jgi:hypothetical protein